MVCSSALPLTKSGGIQLVKLGLQEFPAACEQSLGFMVQPSASPSGLKRARTIIVRSGWGLAGAAVLLAVVGAILLSQRSPVLARSGDVVHLVSKLVMLFGLLVSLIGYRLPQLAARFSSMKTSMGSAIAWGTKKPSKSSITVACLMVVHLLVGIVTAYFSADRPAISSCIFISVIFCQTSLVGMWGGFGHTHWLLRCPGVVVGIVYLGVLLGLGIGELEGEVFLLVSVATGGIALTTWGVRCFKARLVHVARMRAEASEGLRFSIKHLMLLTFVVACLITVGKLLAPHLRGVDQTTQILALALCFVSVALAAIWAMLGLRTPILRIPFVFLIAGPAGWLGGYIIDHSDYGFWTSTTILQAVLLVASLFAVRAVGYRLMAKRKPS